MTRTIDKGVWINKYNIKTKHNLDAFTEISKLINSNAGEVTCKYDVEVQCGLIFTDPRTGIETTCYPWGSKGYERMMSWDWDTYDWDEYAKLPWRWPGDYELFN